MRIERLIVASAVVLLTVGVCVKVNGAAAPGSAAAPAAALATQASRSFDLNPDKAGVFAIGQLTFMVVHKSETWAPAWQRDLIPESGYPKTAGDLQQIRGVLKTDSGRYDFSEELRRGDADTIRLAYRAAPQGAPTRKTRALYLSVSIPLAEYRGQTFYADDAACVLPWWHPMPFALSR